MSSDRELLELAARAAGIEGEWSKTIGGWDCLITSGHHPWQPLHDDGDALRLAVKLGIGVDHAAMRSWAYRSWGTPTVLAQEEFHDQGKEAATRRAIVRAAAAIGSQQ